MRTTIVILCIAVIFSAFVNITLNNKVKDQTEGYEMTISRLHAQYEREVDLARLNYNMGLLEIAAIEWTEAEKDSIRTAAIDAIWGRDSL